MRYQREARAVLSDWREVQREMIAVKQGMATGAALNVEYKALHAEAKRLRLEYQGLVQEARGHDQPLPPAFPTDGASESTEPPRV